MMLGAAGLGKPFRLEPSLGASVDGYNYNYLTTRQTELLEAPFL